MTEGLHEPLEAVHVRATVEELYDRITARFPDRGLRHTAGDLMTIIDEISAGADEIHGRIRLARLTSRIVMVAILIGTALALAIAVRDFFTGFVGFNAPDLLPLIESTINDVVFAGIAVFFLWSFPDRVERGRLLNLLHQLRSAAHIVDMHQLSKDPQQLRPDYQMTAVSKRLDLDRDQLERYLDYCSELLSLVGKAAALCAEESRDQVILETVSRIETLTVGLSRKIWQKISNLPPAGSAAQPDTD
ncbi:hypothetical protein [Nocardioides sp.]|uniref:hypothetical protein n=1 Tax=Nocardioides sp. TaxID=35761 RepID=UPI00356A5D23